MQYGAKEAAYAEQFAQELEREAAFREWVIGRTELAPLARGARLLNEEMLAARSTTASTWWRSYFTEKCRCEGCRGQETDLLAIFESSSGERFAIHFEVKQPADRFPAGKDQAGSYTKRAECWAASPPKAVLKHQLATSALLCSADRLTEYAPHLSKFGAIFTFEEVRRVNPRAAPAAL